MNVNNVESINIFLDSLEGTYYFNKEEYIMLSTLSNSREMELNGRIFFKVNGYDREMADGELINVDTIFGMVSNIDEGVEYEIYKVVLDKIEELHKQAYDNLDKMFYIKDLKMNYKTQFNKMYERRFKWNI